ncbi:hypothetical protein C8R46DRAFT_1125294 [Mycena filopes]|nr:hypothetical protein C8R46DRAFT_1125294 [Mycena filopes]
MATHSHADVELIDGLSSGVLKEFPVSTTVSTAASCASSTANPRTSNQTSTLASTRAATAAEPSLHTRGGMQPAAEGKTGLLVRGVAKSVKQRNPENRPTRIFHPLKCTHPLLLPTGISCKVQNSQWRLVRLAGVDPAVSTQFMRGSRPPPDSTSLRLTDDATGPPYFDSDISFKDGEVVEWESFVFMDALQRGESILNCYLHSSNDFKSSPSRASTLNLRMPANTSTRPP